MSDYALPGLGYGEIWSGDDYDMLNLCSKRQVL